MKEATPEGEVSLRVGGGGWERKLSPYLPFPLSFYPLPEWAYDSL